MADTISDENFIGTDEDGTSYYADEDGNIAAVASDGTVTTTNASDAPDSDNYDGTVETYNTDTSSEYTFDDNGNLVDQDTGKQVDTSHWTDVMGVATEQDGKTTPVAGYTYAGTDKNGNPVYSNPNGRNFTEEQLQKNAELGDKDAKAAQNLATTYGPSAMNPDVLNTYKENPESMREVLANAADGNPAAQALAAAITGTVPTNVKDDRVYEMLADMEDRIAKGEDVKSAYTNAGNKVGLTDDMSSLKTIIEMVGPSLIAGPLAGAAARAATAGKVGKLLNYADRLNKASKGTKYARAAAGSAAAGTKNAMRALDLMDKGSKVAGILTGATGAAGAGLGAAGAGGSSGRDSGGSSGSPYNQPNQAATDIINGRTKEGESGDDKLAAAETPKASTPTPTKPDPVITGSDPFGKGEPTDISIPKGPLEGTPLSGVGLPEPEDPNAGKERGFEDESSDSGDDTLETTTQDAPTGGVGTDTFVNPNDDTRKGWGLGEEDPNRANYDIDKWNRGMEKVSTDVVSDAKVKNFITKTFKDDPVLMKTVKIMKSKK